MEIQKSIDKDWHVLRFEGNFNVVAIFTIRKEFEKMENEDAPKIAMDFSKVEMVDSSAVSLLSNFSKRILEKKGVLAAYNLSDYIFDVFNIVSLEKTIHLYKTLIEFERVENVNFSVFPELLPN